MPGLDGFELRSKLQESDSKVPIIFVTAHGDIPSSVRAIKAGAMEYFTKPFDPEALLDAVGSAVQRCAFRSAAGGSRTDRSDLRIIRGRASPQRILEGVDIVAGTAATALIHLE